MLLRVHSRIMMFDYKYMQDGSMVMVVQTEEEKKEVEEEIQEMGAERKRLLAVEIEC